MVELAALVGKTLDEFEQLPIEAVVRRTQRIALLNGDTIEAARFRLELTQLATDDSAKEVAKSLWRARPVSDLDGFNDLYREGMRRLSSGALIVGTEAATRGEALVSRSRRR